MTILKKILTRAEQAREARRRRLQKEEALIRAIDQVVKTSAPVICSLHDCRRDLRTPVANALDYIERSIDAIPGPAALTPSNWDRDRLLQALFVDAEEIQAFLTSAPRLRTFFAKHQTAQAAALLTATKRERTIFGTAVEGHIVRRDVAQTAVEFHDHRIIDPCASMDETRRALKERALNALVTHILERLLTIRTLKDELKEQQRLLSIQFKIQQTRMQGLEALTSDATDRKSAAPTEPQVFADIERQLHDLGAESDCPEAYLRQLTRVLNAPQQVLTVTPIRLRLNWMGVKQGDPDADGEDAVRLAEVGFQGRLKRAAVFVTIIRQDCLKL